MESTEHLDPLERIGNPTKPRRVWYARLGAGLFGLTYFGWMGIAFIALGMLADSVAQGSTSAQWWAIEGELYVYLLAIGGPAIIIGPLAIYALVTHRKWALDAATVLSAIQVPLLVWAGWRQVVEVINMVQITLLMCFPIGVMVCRYAFSRAK